MVAKGHMVAVPKRPDEATPSAPEERPAETQTLTPRESVRESLRRTPPKLLAVVIVLALIAASVGFVWSYYYRHWSVDEIEQYVISDPTEDSPGFKHQLAGRTATVEGTLTNFTAIPTNLGTLNILQLDRNDNIQLMSWGGTYTIGHKVAMDVRFEWSECNLERHVYSPQIGFPGLQYLLSIGIVVDAVSLVGTSIWMSCDNYGEDVKIQIHWTDEPVSLQKANASVAAGRHSWMMEYIDVMDRYTQMEPSDRMARLDQGVSDRGMIQFHDANDDNYLDDGDYFILSGLTRPTADSAVKCYMFDCQYPNELSLIPDSGSHLTAYLIMTNKGVVGHDLRAGSSSMTPQTQIMNSIVGEARRFTVSKLISSPIPWSETRIQFSNSGVYNETVISPGDLLGGEPTTKAYPDLTFNGVTYACSVTDLAGNDQVDIGDYVTFRPAAGAFQEGAYFQMGLVYMRTHERMGSSEFVIGDQPFSNVTMTRLPEEITLEFSETMHNESDKYFYRHMDVSWNDTLVRLSDGANTTEWGPLKAQDLGSIVDSGRDLGNLNISCTFHDLQDNGFVNRGDAITFLVLSGGGFSASRTYEVEIEYRVTGDAICGATFTG